MPPDARAQLVVPFNPGLPSASETKLSHALAQWRGLNLAEREAAILIVKDAAGTQRIYANSAISALNAER